MSISDIVSVTITKQTTGIDQVGFGTPVIFSTEAAVDSKFSETAKLYGSDIAEFGSSGDDYDTDGATYKKVLALLSQNPKVDQIVIGKRANSPLMTVDVTPNAVDSTLYRITISGAHTATSTTGSTDFDFTSDASATVAEITAGLEDAMSQAAWVTATAYAVGDYVSNNNKVYICTTAGTSGAPGPSGTGSAITDGTVVWAYKGPTQNIVGTDNTTYVTVEKAVTPGGAGTAGIPFVISVNDRSLLEQQNVTADPGLAADLTAVRTAVDGNDDWYLALLDSYGQAEIEAFAALIETTGTPGKAYFFATSDADCLTSAIDDVMSNLQSSAYVRTMGIWHEDPSEEAPDAAWAGVGLPEDPGSITWNLKTLAGVPYSTLTTSEKANLASKDGNYYIRIAGVNLTQSGITPGNEFFDVTRGIDFCAARLQENIFARLQALKKVPFTDAGIAVVENEVRGVMLLCVTQSIFTNDPEPTVTAPLASAVAAVDRANRLLPDVEFRAQLAGAIHTVEVSGIVTV